MVEYFAYNEKVNGSNPLLPFKKQYFKKLKQIIIKRIITYKFLAVLSKNILN